MMKQIIKPNIITRKILGDQEINESCKYRLIKYNHSCSVDNGILIINFLTFEMLYLSENETQLLYENVFNDIKRELIAKWFLVPENSNDLKLYNQVENTRKIVFSDNSTDARDCAITSYTVLTTTDCNARCFYCFEMGRNRTMMTEKTAYDLVEYIEKNCNGKPVKLRWFGGEPLYNVNVIDIICNGLADKKIKYESNIVTNGYLFNDEIIKRAGKLWNLKNIQITLDGTENVYNKVKAYIYKDTNAFKIVTDNIEKLLTAGFNVFVRMNMDFHNGTDLYRLVDYLYERYSAFKNFTVYAHLLFEEHGKKRSIDEKKELVKSYIALEDYMYNKQIFRHSFLNNTYKKANCMASKDNSVVVMTDGKLGKCEYYTDSDAWGSIYSDIIDYDAKNKYKAPRKFFPQCDDCAYRPFCLQKSACPHAIKDCDNVDRMLTFLHFEKYMKVSYENFCNNDFDKVTTF